MNVAYKLTYGESLIDLTKYKLFGYLIRSFEWLTIK